MSRSLSGSWIKMLNLEHLDGVQAQTANIMTQRKIPRHVHQEYVFSLLIKGAMEIDCGHRGEKHILQQGDLFLTEADKTYTSQALGEPPWHYYSISISKEKLAALLDSAADGKHITLPNFTYGAVQSNKLGRMFLKLHDSLTANRSHLEQESFLLDWVISTHQAYADKSERTRTENLRSETATIRRVREFIAENFAENVKLQDLAEIAQLSPFHLNRLFATQIGLPPHAFQNQLRIEKARNLIAHKKSLSEIAHETGFSDQSHFIRFFKRYVGVTPKQFFTQ